MKRSLILLVACMLLFGIKAQDSADFVPYKKGVDPEFLLGLKSRFEISGGIGYAFINNLAFNTKTTTFEKYNQNLSGGLKADISAGYNFTNSFQVRLAYGYRTTKASDVYTINQATDSASVLYLSDHYQFHQMDISVLYRFGLVGERLYFVPEVGAGYLFFNNKGTFNEEYIQKNNGWVFNAGLGFDYLASNIVGIGLHSNYNYTRLNNVSTEYPNGQGGTNIEEDNKFGFFDVTIKLLIFL